MEDIADGLRRLGHEVLVLDFEALGIYDPGRVVTAAGDTLRQLRSFAPDAMLSYATAGLIEVGAKDGGEHLFEALKLPYALLFFDAPLEHEAFFRKHAASDYLSVFCWDQSYLDWIRQFGVRRLSHLPLATNPARFAMDAPMVIERERAFVGSINSAAGMACSPGLKVIQQKMIERRMQSPTEPFDVALAAVAASLPSSEQTEWNAFAQSPSFTPFVFDTLRMSDAAYRRGAVCRLASGSGITVFGGAEWAGMPTGVRLSGPVEYGSALAAVYASTAVNINLTNGHVRETVNQRVFDCPAAGGFLLTDERVELSSLFDLGHELAVFRTLDELQALAERYGGDETERKKLTARARRRVLSEHTWEQRLRTLTASFP